jgi:hypothetical protein
VQTKKRPALMPLKKWITEMISYETDLLGIAGAAGNIHSACKKLGLRRERVFCSPPMVEFSEAVLLQLESIRRSLLLSIGGKVCTLLRDSRCYAGALCPVSCRRIRDGHSSTSKDVAVKLTSLFDVTARSIAIPTIYGPWDDVYPLAEVYRQSGPIALRASLRKGPLARKVQSPSHKLVVDWGNRGEVLPAILKALKDE